MSGLSKYQSGKSSTQNRKNQNRRNDTPQIGGITEQQRINLIAQSQNTKLFRTINQPILSNIKKYSSEKPSSLIKITDRNRAKMQYKKYISDTQNVPYEDREQAIKIRQIGNAILFLLPIFLYLLLTMASILYFITPVQICPPNAECGVFIWCNQDFELKQNNECEMNQNIIIQADRYCEIMANYLQYQYGNQDCQTNQTFARPQMKYEQLRNKYQIEKKLLNDQILRNIMNPHIQNKYGFVFNQSTYAMAPTLKKRSMLCELKIQASRPIFKVIGVVVIVVSCLAVVLYRRIKRNKLARTIYNKLKKMCEQEGTVNVSSRLNEIGESSLDQSLFVLIDKQRLRDQKIMYYEDQNKLYWKSIK